MTTAKVPDSTTRANPAERLSRLNGARWPAGAYARAELPERVLQFGTGMLLRALSAASVDAANRAGAFNGRIAVVQSTAAGVGGAINAQDGLFTLVERGLENRAPVDRARIIGSISRALVAGDEWNAVRDLVARAELRVIVSNVTEAGFHLGASFPSRLTDLLHARFTGLRDGPELFVIPTELVPSNGPRLSEMVQDLAAQRSDARAFRAWLSERVRFCSSLVDRITTGVPTPAASAELEARLGYSDALLTVTEPHALWAIEGDPDELRSAFAIDNAAGVAFASDISFYRERKLRLLNGAHSAVAPLALLGGVRTVREAVGHPRLGPFLREVLFEEIVPSLETSASAATSYAQSVAERFGNPWLDHEWRTIATNQGLKMRIRLVPSVASFARTRGHPPQALALSFAAYLRYAREADAELSFVDAALWGPALTSIPGFAAAVTEWLLRIDRDGVDATLDTLLRARGDAGVIQA